MNGQVSQHSSASGHAIARRLFLGFALPLLTAGAILSAWVFVRDRGLFAFSWLLAFAFVWTICTGALFFVALHYVARAAWSTSVRRIAEMFSLALPLVALMFLPVLHYAKTIYAWLDPAYLAATPVVAAKAHYLNLPFFTIRAAVYFALWIGYAVYFARKSLRQDAGRAGADATASMRSVSAPFMLIFAFTVTFASFDWIMSLAPRWYSAVFGVYVFSGMAIAAFATVILATLWLRRQGALRIGERECVGEVQLYSLGAWLFAFSAFWGYIAMSQYLLVWYGNMPEETVWCVDRWDANWKYVCLLMLTLRFTVPFLALLSRRAKTSPTSLIVISLLTLAGQIVDLHWMILPAFFGKAKVFSWFELGPLCLMTGIVAGFAVWFIRRYPSIAANDPLLEDSKRAKAR